MASYWYVYQGSDSIDPTAVSYSSTSPKGGDTLTITVTASSSNTYGGTITYVFSYSTDGGSTWTSLGSTTSTSISMTVPTTISQLQVRVYAKDNYGFTSTTYVYGDNLTVTQNNAPTITSDTASGTDFGTLTEGFTLEYTVADTDGDTVTVSEYLDDVLQRSYTATLDSANTFACVTTDNWQTVLNGSHTLKAVADDGNGGSASYSVTFTKKVTSASVTLETPLDADDSITVMVMNLTGSLPDDVDLSVQVTNNALDDSPVWEDATEDVQNGANHVFTNSTAVNGYAFNFLVTMARGSSDTGGYLTNIGGAFE